MADTMIGGGSGGSMVIMLRVLGISGTTIRATCDSNTVSGTIGSTGYLYLKLKTLGVWSVTASKSGYSLLRMSKFSVMVSLSAGHWPRKHSMIAHLLKFRRLHRVGWPISIGRLGIIIPLP